MLPQPSHAGASDWKSANCSLRAVFGPASLGMMPARARRAVLISPWPLPLALPFTWPLVWPVVLACGFIVDEPLAVPGAVGFDFASLSAAAADSVSEVVLR